MIDPIDHATAFLLKYEKGPWVCQETDDRDCLPAQCLMPIPTDPQKEIYYSEGKQGSAKHYKLKVEKETINENHKLWDFFKTKDIKKVCVVEGKRNLWQKDSSEAGGAWVVSNKKGPYDHFKEFFVKPASDDTTRVAFRVSDLKLQGGLDGVGDADASIITQLSLPVPKS